MYANLAPGLIGIRDVDFERTVQLALDHGFEGIDPPLGEMQQTADVKRFVDRLAEAGLKWGSFGLPVEFGKDAAAFDRTFEPLREMAQTAQQAGVTRCSTWILPGSNELDFGANFKQHEDRLTECAKVLADCDIRLGLEFVAPKTMVEKFEHPFIHTLDGMLELAEAIGARSGARMGILLDSWHWYTSGATTDDILTKLNNEKIVLVHVNDAPADRSRDQQIDNERALPCETGVIDAAGFVGCLRQLAYDGPVTAEPFVPALGQMPADEAAEKVGRAVKRMLSLA